MHTPLAALLALFALALPALAQDAAAPAAATSTPPDAPQAKRDIGPAKKLGWRLGVQCWTFRDRSLFETIDTTKSLGMRYVEMYPGQRTSPEDSTKFNHDSTPEQRAAVKQKLKDAGVVVMNYGVVNIPKDEAEARKVFD